MRSLSPQVGRGLDDYPEVYVSPPLGALDPTAHDEYSIFSCLLCTANVSVGGLDLKTASETTSSFEMVSYSYQPEPMISPSWRTTQECLIPSSPVAGLRKT